MSESQLGWWNSQLNGEKCLKPPTIYIYIHNIYPHEKGLMIRPNHNLWEYKPCVSTMVGPSNVISWCIIAWIHMNTTYYGYLHKSLIVHNKLYFEGYGDFPFIANHERISFYPSSCLGMLSSPYKKKHLSESPINHPIVAMCFLLNIP